MDTLSKEKRSWNMSRIKSKDTAPELYVRSLLHRNGYRFRLHVKDLPGKPDIVLPKYKTVIFVHGCFWHQHPMCVNGKIPAVNYAWWQEKLQRNQQRDKKHIKELISCGWRVMIVWECLIKGKTKNAIKELYPIFSQLITAFLLSSQQLIEISSDFFNCTIVNEARKVKYYGANHEI